MSIINRPSPTLQERILPNDAFICSKTDTRGKILYGNSIFKDFAGYSEKQLIGKPHNIIRHPDMPRGVFKALWDTISAGKEFMGYVKNMSADGGFYWVYATVTPDFDANGEISGYYSVRRKPKQNIIQKIEPLYKKMLAEELKVNGSEAPSVGLAVLQQAIREAGKNDYTSLVLSL